MPKHSLAAAIARLVPIRGSLSSVCVPTALGGDFADALVAAAENKADNANGANLFAVRVVDDDLAASLPRVNAGVAEEYRAGSRLFVWVEGEYQPLTSMSSTVTPLIGAGFPADATSKIAVQAVADACTDMLAIMDSVHLVGNDESLLREAMQSVFLFLRDSFEGMTGSNAPWTAAWWRSVDSFFDRLLPRLESRSGSGPGIVATVFASAGLPVPRDEKTKYSSIKPIEFAALVENQLSDPDDARETLAWAKAQGTAKSLNELDWEGLPVEAAVSGHPGAALCSLRKKDGSDSFEIWTSTSEQDIKKLMDIRSSDRAIEAAWKSKELSKIAGDCSLLPAPDAQWISLSKNEVEVRFEEFNFLVPWRENIEPDLAAQVDDAQISFSPKAGWRFDGMTAKATQEGLLLSGHLIYHFKSGQKWLAKPVKVTTGRVQSLLGKLDIDSTCRIVLPFPSLPNIYIVERDKIRVASNRGKQFKINKQVFLPTDEEPESISFKSETDASVIAYRYPQPFTESVQLNPKFTVGRATSVLSDLSPRMTAVDSLRITNGLEIRFDDLDDPAVLLSVEEELQHPWLPLAATAIGTTPQDAPCTRESINRLRGYLEELWRLGLSKLTASRERSSPVWFVLPTGNGSDRAGQQTLAAPHVSWLANPPSGYPASIEHAGPGPSESLLNTHEFGSFLSALAAIEERLGATGAGGSSVWACRWQLKDLPQDLVDQYLASYAKLSVVAKESTNPGDVFWAAYPFSAIVYDVTKGVVSAILLSPLHPVRLAWLYGAERAVIESGVVGNPKRLAVAQVIEGWNFPFFGPAPSFEDSSTLAATPIDAGPDQLFLGWSALCYFDQQQGGHLTLPPYAAGRRMPGSSSSGLNQGGVGAAIRDFMRVYPHLSTLSLDLYSSTRAPRSSELDIAVLAEVARVAIDESDAVPLPQSLRVLDSTNREGSPPDRDEAFAAFAPAAEESVPSFEWRMYDATKAQEQDADIRFVEDAQVKVSLARAKGEESGSIGKWPIRRFLGRSTGKNGELLLHPYLFPSENAWPAFRDALAAIEKQPFTTTDALRVTTQSQVMGTNCKSKWVVTGNNLADPASISKLASAADSILWEWRPPFLPRRNAGSTLDFGRRPYVTIAKIPKPFRDRLTSLRGLTAERSNRMIELLGRRGIGLASLLAMGGNHAEGALGFYLALALLDTTVKAFASAASRAFVVPLDAVNGLLSALAVDESDAIRRADLLLIIVNTAEDASRVTLLPIEIRCTGFTSDSTATSFPHRSSNEVNSKLQQLQQSQECLRKAVESGCVDGRPAYVNLAAIASLVETACLLDDASESWQLGSEIIRSVSQGKATFVVAPGILLWFQRLAGGTDRVVALPPTQDSPNGCVFIDPTDFADQVWSGTSGELALKIYATVMSCLENEVAKRGPCDAQQHSPDPAPDIATPTPDEIDTPAPSEPVLVANLPDTNLSEATIQAPPEPIPEVALDGVPQTIGNERPKVFIGTSTGLKDGVWWDPYNELKRLNNAHTVILGSAGSGKTQLLTSFLFELHKQNVPCLILDFKDDYVSQSVLEAVGATLHDATDGIPVNPLALQVDEISGKINPVQQVYAMCGIFKAVYGLGDIQEAHLREAIFKTYQASGIKRAPVKFDPTIVAPEFDSVKMELEAIDDQSLLNRLSPIFDLSLFRRGDDTLENLLNTSSVLRFTQLPNEEVKKAAGGIVLSGIYNAILKRGHYRGIRLALVIDEAHRVANLNPVRLLVKEARAYGVAVFLSSQEARDFDDFVFSNAGTLIALKLSETGDADRVARLLSGDKDYKPIADQLRNLEQFQGFVRNDQHKPHTRTTIRPFYERL